MKLSRVFWVAVVGMVLFAALPARAVTTGSTGGGQPVNNIQPALAVSYIIAMQGVFPSRDGAAVQGTILGEVRRFGGQFAPSGWAFAEGQILAINQNTALFSLLGTTYGGNGQTTFALPDLRGRTPIHVGQGPGLTNRTLGVPGGSETVTLGLAMLPSHTHSSPFGNTDAAGGGQAFDNTMPYLGLSFIISLSAGGFPSTSGTNPATFLGEVRMFAGNFAPAGWAFTDGQILPINQNTAVFSLLGTTYGGDGRATFALPDLRGRAPLHEGTGAGLAPHPLGESAGLEQLFLSTAQLPPHTHTIPDNVPTGITGSGQTHANNQPGLALTSLFAIAGTFPSTSGTTGDNFLAEMRWFAGNFAPGGWVTTDGQLLPINQDQAVFSLIGTIYGGNGQTTFALPDQRGRAAIHQGQGPGLSSHPIGALFGTESELVTINQMAPHVHLIALAAPAYTTWSLALLLVGLAFIGARRVRNGRARSPELR